MSTLSQELKRWAVEELELPAARLPDDGYIKTLCVGSGASIWKYITQHVHKERNVRAMRGNIQWYKVLQDKELKNQSDEARRLEIQSEIEALQAELGQLDTKIIRMEDQLAAEEQSLTRSWKDFTERRCRQILLDCFREHCSEERTALVQDALEIGVQRQALENLSKKAEMTLVFAPSDNSGVSTEIDPFVLKEVRELCNERVLFFQSLLESELEVNQITEFTQHKRNAVIQHWMSAVENVLRSHPPSQVLLALRALTSRQQVALEEKTTNLEVKNDASSLGFHSENVHATDVSTEEELTPVHNLLQFAWEEVDQNYFHLAQTRGRCQQLETEITALLNKADTKYLIDPATSRCVFELEVEAVKQAAVRDCIREQYAQLQLQARHCQDALKATQTECHSVMESWRLVNQRQEQIRSLIKGNSCVKTELTRVHTEVVQYLQQTLSPQFESVVQASSRLRNSVSQGAMQFSGVSLAALDRRATNGGEKLPAAQLSIHRIQSPAFQKLCQTLSFPVHMAPEQLWSWAASKQLELRTLHRLLRLLTESSKGLQTLMAQLPAPDQQTLLRHVKTLDEEILQTLLPRTRELNLRFSKGLLYLEQVKTAITHWWEQPAQFVLPEMKSDGLSFQQWLQRWKLATNPCAQ